MTPLYGEQRRCAGLAVLAGITLLLALPLGQFDGVKGWPFRGLVAVHFMLLLAALGAGIRSEFRMLRAAGGIGALVAIISALALLFIGLQAALPVTSRDALIHHLAVPKWWNESGKIVFFGWHEWSYYPMLLQIAFTGLLGAGLEALTPYAHAIYLLLLSIQVSLFTRDRLDDPARGAIAGAVVLTIPLCLRLASEPLVDLGLALYTFIAAVAWLNWCDGKAERGWAILSGAAMGLALGTKFNALLFGAVFAPAALLCGLNARKASEVIRAASMALLFAILLYAPWMLRNYFATGNPFFPLLKNHFSARPSEQLPGPRGLNPLEQRRMQYQESWLEIGALPLRIFVQGEDNVPRLFDGRLSALLMLAFLPLLRKERSRWQALLLGVGGGYVLLALLLSGARVRYLIPAIAPLGVVAVAALPWLSAKKKVVGMVLFLLHVSLSIVYAAGAMGAAGTLQYLFGPASAGEYLRARDLDYRMAEYVNERLPAHTRIYLLFTSNRFYYFDRPVLSAGHHSGRELIGWLQSGASADDLERRFRGKGVTHLLAFAPRMKEALEASLDDAQRRTWNEFQGKRLSIVHQAYGMVLWSLNPEAEGGRE